MSPSSTTPVTSATILSIDGGMIEGEIATCRAILSDDDPTLRYRVFKGIPFAAPPVGPLRWRAPQPVTPWDGILHADAYRDAPVQPDIAADSIMRQFSFDTPPECGRSEDCLYLNVWAPIASDAPAMVTPTGRRPVIVWLYGGGHRVGSASHPVTDGGYLASQGAVIVSVNYRLGALGYLAHPALTAESGASGHYALLDILAALKWVRRNIGAFGGDPACVTLFGQSAGAALAQVLATSQQASGLFHRLIIHSAGRFQGGPMGSPMRTLAAAEALGKEIADATGATHLDAMRALPADALPGPRGTWTPIIDGHVLTASVQHCFDAGTVHRMPLLAGYTEDEAAPYPQPALQTRAGFLAYAQTEYGAQAGDFLALYPHADDDEAKRSSYAVRRDTAFAYQPYQFAEYASAAGVSDVYLFQFTRRVPVPDGVRWHEPSPPNGYGAYHGGELWYVFHSQRTHYWIGANRDDASRFPWPWATRDRALAREMSHAWLAFARTGSPNTPDNAGWPAYTHAAPFAMRFGDRTELAEPSNLAALRFHAAYYRWQRRDAGAPSAQ